MPPTPNRGAPMKLGPTGPPAGRRRPFSLKSRISERFWPQEWSGWVRTCRRIHLVFVSSQTVDSDSFRTKFDVFGPDRNFGQPGFGLGLALDKPNCCWEDLSETWTSVLSQQKTSVLSQHQSSGLRHMLGARHQSGPKWVENRRFGLKLGPEACQDCPGAFEKGLTHSEGTFLA